MHTVPLCSPESSTEAFHEVVAAIRNDIPLLMIGGGDIPDVNEDSKTLVAELTAQYIARLVDAAVDAHDILTDGAGGVLPPPAKPHKRKPPIPLKPEKKSSKPAADNTLSIHRDKRKRPGIDYWDDPLPNPKIGGKSILTGSSFSGTTGEPKKSEWVGVAGVDLFEVSRTRRAFASSPSTIDTKCFIFPICHDAQLYDRVKKLQSARRNIGQLLVDPVVMDMVRTEGTQKKRRLGLKGKIGEGGEEDHRDDDDDDDEETNHMEAAWPGLEALLPIHRVFNEVEDENQHNL